MFQFIKIVFTLFLLLFSISCDEEEINGCTDDLACNYNPKANKNDNSCKYVDLGCGCGEDAAEENYDCEGNCIADIDCLGMCGGIAIIDICGECNGPGIVEGACDCNGNSGYDCNGQCAGLDILDECGECSGDGIDTGACDCDGTLPQIYCLDNDGDQLGQPGTEQQFCIENLPINFVTDCSDSIDSCSGILDDCGICNGLNLNQDCTGECFGNAINDCLGVCNGDAIQDCAGICNGNATYDCAGICNGIEKVDCDGICGGSSEVDCMGVCNGNNILDDRGICCQSTEIQDIGDINICLPLEFRWSLTMTATLGTYNHEDSLFIPFSPLISDDFTIGTHYLSTNGLDLLGSASYNDVAQAISTVENSIYLYAPHPEWGYEFGNNFTQEFKFHDIEALLESESGIFWDGELSSDVFENAHIKISFGLDSEQIIGSNILFSFNDLNPIVYPEVCGESFPMQYFFSNVEIEEDLPIPFDRSCNVINEDFEYIIPAVLMPSDTIPFYIIIKNTYIY